MGRIDPPEPVPALVAMTAPPGGAAPITIVALAHCEPLLAPFLGWAAALALEGQLPKRDHELLALRTAHNCRSRFEWQEHAAFARQAGLTDDEIDRVAAGADAGWERNELALLRAADELHRDTKISRATWTLLSEYYGTAELVEAVYVVGQYTMLSMVANVVEDE
jgi:4-carboxymuconolactone decarboxylase